MGSHARVRSPRVRYIIAFVFIFFIAACGQTAVRPLSRIQNTNLPPPVRILIYDFTMADAVVKEYQGILRQQPTSANPAERASQIKRDASEAAIFELLSGLRGLGFTAVRAARGTPTADNELAIDGEFLTVDQGNPLRRLLIGFGSGASKVEKIGRAHV